MRDLEATFFRELTLRICGSLDIDRALHEAFSYLRQRMPADAIGLGFNNLDQPGEDPKVVVVASAGRPGARYLWRHPESQLPIPPAAAEQTRAAGPELPVAWAINRPEELHPALHGVFPGVAHSSALFLRLELTDGLTGVLLISAEGHDRYTPEHVQLVESVREPVAIAMANARRYRELSQLRDLLAEDNRALTADIQRAVGVEVVGADFGLRTVMEQVRQVAPASSATLLLGETGTGKEVIAHAIHLASPRSQGPMISMQCGAIPETLLDSELFGHERGAFTGATERKRGRFERAHGGTLFLDEVGELSPGAQVKLLRVLQEKRFERVGGSETVRVDVRVIAATHRDLEQRVRQGSFREDLWYRLNVLPIRIPPLRLRREDIPSLVMHFLERKSLELNLPHVPSVSAQDLERMRQYDWPGNVRELQNIIERALLISRGGRLTLPPLGARSRAVASGPATAAPGIATLDEAMAAHIRDVLERVGWQVAGRGGAAEVLGLNPSTLRFRMQKLGISRPRI